MNNKSFICAIFCLVLIIGCGKDAPMSEEPVSQSIQSGQASDLIAEGTQISGIGYYAETGECNDAAGRDADYAVKMTGDLQGCIYAFIDKAECVGNGYYLEEGRELFVGTYKGEACSFRTTYKFLGKYEGCSGGAPTGAEILGFCDHHIVKGSDKGALKGVTGGRYYMIDKVKRELKFPYEGQIKF